MQSLKSKISLLTIATIALSGFSPSFATASSATSTKILNKTQAIKQLQNFTNQTTKYYLKNNYVRTYQNPTQPTTQQLTDPINNVKVTTISKNGTQVNYLINGDYYYSSKPEYFTDSQVAKAKELGIDLYLPWAYAQNYEVATFSPTYLKEDLDNLGYALLDTPKDSKYKLSIKKNITTFSIPKNFNNNTITITITDNIISKIDFHHVTGTQYSYSFQPSKEKVIAPKAIPFDKLN